jgi:hypothetical protein
MIIFLKAFAIGLALLSLAKSYVDYKRRLEPPIMFVFWVLVWVGATVLVVYPVIIEQLTELTKDSSLTIGSVTSLSYIFMLYIVYRIYTKAARLEHQLAQITRKIALMKRPKRKKQLAQ